MHYRLGEFHPLPGLSHEWLPEEPTTPESMRLALEETIHGLISPIAETRSPADHQVELSAFPDLLRKMTPRHHDASWVHAVHQRLSDLRRSLDIRLLACEYQPGPDGFLCIAATTPSIAHEVVPGDEVQAGFVVIRDRARPVRVSQRIFRVACWNGSINSVHEADERTADDIDLSTMVSRCFDRRAFEEALQILREAARPGNVNEHLMLDELEDIRVDRVRMDEVLLRWQQRGEDARRDGEDPSLWDFVNDMTEVARDLPDWRDRLDLEEAAGRLARLRAPKPRRTPGEARMLVGIE